RPGRSVPAGATASGAVEPRGSVPEVLFFLFLLLPLVVLDVLLLVLVLVPVVLVPVVVLEVLLPLVLVTVIRQSEDVLGDALTFDPARTAHLHNLHGGRRPWTDPFRPPGVLARN